MKIKIKGRERTTATLFTTEWQQILENLFLYNLVTYILAYPLHKLKLIKSKEKIFVVMFITYKK